jgi:CBS domain containing-hemolysin-like protein
MIIIIELMCLLFTSFFAGIETGLLSADKLRIYSRCQAGTRWAKSADYLLQKPERLLGTTLIGTNISVVTGAVILNNFLRINYTELIALIGSFILTIVYLLFAEIIPKNFFRQYADTITVRLAPVLHIFFFIFFPISFILNNIVRVLMILAGQRKIKSKLPQSKDDFRTLMHLSSKESGFEYADYRAIDDILDFGETLAMEAMIPLHTYPVFHIDTPPLEVLRTAEKNNQRFFPCYAIRTDNIEGFIDTNDFLNNDADSIKAILREPVFYPETKPLPDLLDVMVDDSLEVVFLVDEYSAVVGMVTHKEIASEIIGFIPGNIYTIQENVIPLNKNTFQALGTADLEYFCHITKLNLKKRNAETIGGYLCEKLGCIPKPGTEYIEKNVHYTILEGSNRSINKIKVEIRSESGGE